MRRKKRVDIVRANRDFPVLRDDNLGEDPEVIDVEFTVLGSEGKTPPNDYFRKWAVIFLTTALFWTIIFVAAWLNDIISG